jgi:hypothetical protein
MTDEDGATLPHDLFFERLRALEAEGHVPARAFSIARYESALAQWPLAWGDDFQPLIYGDFFPPDEEVSYPELGIKILPQPVTHALPGALTALQARVQVSDKSDASLRDAAARLNTLLGILAVQSLGNSRFAWRSFITHLHPGGVGAIVDDPVVKVAIARFQALPAAVAQRVGAALFWVREAREITYHRSRSDVVRIFDHWWNAFECLTHAVLAFSPMEKLSKQDKQREMAAILASFGGEPTADAVVAMYKVVNPGFPALAGAALRKLFGDEAAHYINECFHHPTRHERLYAIRNAIKHGDISPDNHQHLLRVEGRIRKLWFMLWRMFSVFLGTFPPLDQEARDAVRRAAATAPPPQ